MADRLPLSRPLRAAPRASFRKGRLAAALLLLLAAPAFGAAPASANAPVPSAAPSNLSANAPAAQLATAAAPADAARTGAPLVLVLQSYQRDYAWTVGIEAGLEAGFASVPAAARPAVLVEHLDAKRRDDPASEAAFAAYLKERYRGTRLAAVVVCDNSALLFAAGHRQELFPGVPLVFCGINDWNPLLLKGESGATGVLERPDYAATAAAALSILPGRRRVYLVSDATLTGRATAADCRRALSALDPKLEISDVPDLPLSGLAEWAAGLPADALLFFLAYVTDGAGVPRRAEEVAAAFGARLPIVTSHDVFFTPGVLGGRIATAEGQGRAAASIALRVLSGESPDSIPLADDEANEYRFSFAELKRWGIDERALPKGSVVVGKPRGFFEREPWAAPLLSSVAFLLLLLATTLVVVQVSQRKAREALAASERKFRGLFQSMAFGVAHHAIVRGRDGKPADYRFIDVNGEFERLLGFGRSEVVDRLASEVYGAPYYLERFASVAAGADSVAFDLPFRDRVYRTTIYSPDPGEFATIFEDVTEHLAARAALEESELRYRSLFDRMEEGVVYEDDEGRVVSANPAAERILGLALESMEGRAPEDPRWSCVRADGSPFPPEELYTVRALVGGRPHSGLMGIHNPDLGKTVWVQASAVPEFKPGAERPFRVFTTLADVSALKEAEVRLEAQAAELAAKNAELERFTYTVSHDLKSPLITIKGFLSCIAEDAASGDAELLASDLGRVSRAADRMQELLSDLLELSRIGRVANPSRRFSMGEAVSQALESLGGLVASSKAEISLPDAWPEAVADEARVAEVWQNLLENAVKYSGGRPPRIVLGWERAEGELRYFARDEGIGIEPRYLGTVFGLFNKLDPKSEGTGIGLALVRRIVELHGGRAWAESGGEGKGATFLFVLPEPPAA